MKRVPLLNLPGSILVRCSHIFASQAVVPALRWEFRAFRMIDLGKGSVSYLFLPALIVNV
jgi:hypothetical protein